MSKIVRTSENAFDPEIRRTYIGGTDAAAICGLSEWKTPFEVWLEKTTGVFPEVSDATQNLFNRGHELEPIIIKKYVETQSELHMIVHSPKFIKDKEHDFICANIDARMGHVFEFDKDYILEAKSAFYSEFQKWTNSVPLNYYCQAQWYLMVTGLNKLVFAVFIVDSWTLETFEVIRDDAFISKIRTTCIDFWNNHVLTNTPPELTLSDLNKVKPQPESIVLADADELIIHAEIKNLMSIKATYENQIEALKNLVKSKMGENAELRLPDSDKPLFTWKSQTRESVDSKKLRELYPDIYNQVTKISESRTFLIK